MENPMRPCVILSAAPLTGEKALRRLLREDCFVIAADGGLLHCERLGRSPDLLVGDFDSLPVSPSFGGECIPLPREKADTDTGFAVKTALERGYRRLFLWGGMGGARTDHTVANFSTLAYATAEGASACLCGGGEWAGMIQNGSLMIPRGDVRYLSVFPWNGSAQGVTLRGVKYPLQDATLTPTFPLGVSNEITDDCARVTVEAGMLLVMTVNGCKF